MPDKPYGAATETNIIPVIGSFEGQNNGGHVQWQLIKGDTKIVPLLSYEDRRDLRMILVSNAISKEGKQSEELLKEYKDRRNRKAQGRSGGLQCQPQFQALCTATAPTTI